MAADQPTVDITHAGRDSFEGDNHIALANAKLSDMGYS